MMPDFSSQLAKRRFYRRVMYGSIAAGIVGFVVASRLEYPLMAVAVYWGGLVGFLAVKFGTDVPIFDERDRALEQQASNLTVYVVGVALLVVGPALFALEETGYYEPPVAVSGMILGFSAMYLVWGAVYLLLRYR